MPTFTLAGPHSEHMMAIKLESTIDPAGSPPSLVALCGAPVTAWDQSTWAAGEFLDRADGGRPWTHPPHKAPSCPECLDALRRLHDAYPDGTDQQWIAARAMTSMALVRQADESSRQARAARDEVVSRCVAAGMSMYAVAHLLGLSQTAVAKIVRG